MSETADALVLIKSVASNCTRSQWILHTTNSEPKKKKNPLSLKKISTEAVKITVHKFQPMSTHLPQILRDECGSHRTIPP